MVQPVGPQSPGTRGPGAVGEKVASAGNFAPIIALLPRQLQNSVLQQLAGQTTAARLVSLTAGGMAQIEVRGQPMEVRLKNVPPGQSPGDTILINFRREDQADDTSALTIRGSGVDRSAANRGAEATRTDAPLIPKTAGQDTPSTAQQLSDTGRLLGALSRLEGRADTALTIAVALSAEGGAAPLIAGNSRNPVTGMVAQRTDTEGLAAGEPGTANSIDGTGGTASTSASSATDQAIVRYTTRLMQDMMKAVENSGLFYEAHLQQWSEGQRSEDDLRSEPQASWGPDDALGSGAIPDTDEPRESVKMVASQLGQLDRPAVNLALPGFFNDRVSLTIEPERQRSTDKEKPTAWFATLRMDLPQLGPLELRITLLSSQCNVLVKTSPESRSIINASFPELMDSMSAAGLRLQAQASDREARHATE